MQNLLEKIYCERGFDFREYRVSTLTRRMERRMRARGVGSYGDYACVLDSDPAEYERLFDDLTINVSGFFRDAAAFKALEAVVLPAIINEAVKRGRGPCIWSAGCATGQEPYSIAMLLMEALGPDINTKGVTLLATDIDGKALDRARQGTFPAKEVKEIPATWRDKYFAHNNKGLSVVSTLVEMISFKIHDLTGEMPWNDMDLVVCRNVLIYFLPVLQTRVLKGFDGALRKDGFLLLGKAEVPVGQAKGLFHCVDSKAKLYQKN